MVFGVMVQLSKLNTSSLVVGDSCVKLSSKVRNLGGIFDNKRKLTIHVNVVCQRELSQISENIIKLLML